MISNLVWFNTNWVFMKKKNESSNSFRVSSVSQLIKIDIENNIVQL